MTVDGHKSSPVDQSNTFTGGSRQQGVKAPRIAHPWQVTAAGTAFVVLAVCELALLVDVSFESFGVDIQFFEKHHIMVEWLAVLGLGLTLVFVGYHFRKVLRDNRKYRLLSELATGEFLHILQDQMDEWQFSESEREIALMLIKGLTIREIASIRQTKPGTIKSQCNAIYRKAGVKGRHELAAYFIEDLMSGLDLTAPENATRFAGK